MDREDQDPRLTQISTQWTLVFQAHRGTPEQVASAQVKLIDRYAGAVHRYLLAALRDQEVAEELAQEFALRFLRGDFHRADPARGRFRDFVRQSLRNLMTDHHRWRSRTRPVGNELPEPTAPPVEDADFDRQFLASWRAELLAGAWRELADLQERTGQPYYTILRVRVDHPDLHSPELAERLASVLGRPIRAGGVRMALKRSRDRFVDFLMEGVAAGLSDPTPDQIEQELIDLDLLQFCKPAATRQGRIPSKHGP
jgi:DNA-directed RNA polymerase specialized sigma24 family protein